MGRDEQRNRLEGYGGGPVTPAFRELSDWYDSGMGHVWLPYSQMKTAAPPIAVTHTEGSRIFLAEGGDLIDGIASWWTACHGYNHPHIRQAVERQLALLPHVMFGGLVHEQALTLARRLAALLPGDLNRVFFSESGSVAVEIARHQSRKPSRQCEGLLVDEAAEHHVRQVRKLAFDRRADMRMPVTMAGGPPRRDAVDQLPPVRQHDPGTVPARERERVPRGLHLRIGQPEVAEPRDVPIRDA